MCSKEAQRCYCEAANCCGLIGGDKQTPLSKSKERRDVAKKKKTAEEWRREFLEDMDVSILLDFSCPFSCFPHN